MNYSYLLISLLLVGCLPASRTASSTSATSSSSEARNAVERSRTLPTLGHDRRTVLTEAEQWIGTPYRYGGTGRDGLDCSGFVCNAYRAADLSLPRTSWQQAAVGQSINIVDAQPGDLVFFNTLGSGVSHVGILINTEQFVHASTSIGVIVSSLNEPYYRDRFLFVRRVLP